jgi:deoxyinosine 3'endonuclease (endonuclease V)
LKLELIRFRVSNKNYMILAIDVYYTEKIAKVAGVIFEFTDPEPIKTVTCVCEDINPYIP